MCFKSREDEGYRKIISHTDLIPQAPPLKLFLVHLGLRKSLEDLELVDTCQSKRKQAHNARANIQAEERLHAPWKNAYMGDWLSYLVYPLLA